MSRINESQLMQMVEDHVVFIDEKTGEEVSIHIKYAPTIIQMLSYFYTSHADVLEV